MVILCFFADLFRNDPDERRVKSLKKIAMACCPELIDRGCGKTAEGIYLQFQVKKSITDSQAQMTVDQVVKVLSDRCEDLSVLDLSVIYISLDDGEYYQIRYFKGDTKVHRL